METVCGLVYRLARPKVGKRQVWLKLLLLRIPLAAALATLDGFPLFVVLLHALVHHFVLAIDTGRPRGSLGGLGLLGHYVRHFLLLLLQRPLVESMIRSNRLYKHGA